MSKYTDAISLAPTDAVGSKQIQKIYLNQIASQIARKSISKMSTKRFKAPADPAFDLASCFISNFLNANGLELSLNTAYEETSGWIQRDKLPIPIAKKLSLNNDNYLFEQLVSSTRHGLKPILEEPPKFKKETVIKQRSIEVPSGTKRVIETSKGTKLKDGHGHHRSNRHHETEERRHHSTRHQRHYEEEKPIRHHTSHRKTSQEVYKKTDDTFTDIIDTQESSPGLNNPKYGMNVDKRKRYEEREHRHHRRTREQPSESFVDTYSEVPRRHRTSNKPTRRREETFNETGTESYINEASYISEAPIISKRKDQNLKISSRSVPKPLTEKKDPTKLTFKERVRKIMMQSRYVDRETQPDNTIGTIKPGELLPNSAQSSSKPDLLNNFNNGPIEEPGIVLTRNIPSELSNKSGSVKEPSNKNSSTKPNSIKPPPSVAESEDEDEGEDAPDPEAEDENEPKDKKEGEEEEDKGEEEDKKEKKKKSKGEEEEDKGEEEDQPAE